MLEALFIKRLMPELNCGLKTSKQLIIFIFVTLYRTTQFLQCSSPDWLNTV